MFKGLEGFSAWADQRITVKERVDSEEKEPTDGIPSDIPGTIYFQPDKHCGFVSRATMEGMLT